MTIERRDSPRDADEKTTLTAFLDYHRATLLWKIDGVGDDDLRRPMVPSGTSLLGLVKHLAYVEQGWFQRTFAGEDVTVPWTDDDPDADFRSEPDETTAQIVEFYERSCARSREIVAAAPLEQQAARARRPETTLRWIVVHMIEETARHNGHADILREMIDGVTGE